AREVVEVGEVGADLESYVERGRRQLLTEQVADHHLSVHRRARQHQRQASGDESGAPRRHGEEGTRWSSTSPPSVTRGRRGVATVSPVHDQAASALAVVGAGRAGGAGISRFVRNDEASSRDTMPSRTSREMASSMVCMPSRRPVWITEMSWNVLRSRISEA